MTATAHQCEYCGRTFPVIPAPLARLVQCPACHEMCDVPGDPTAPTAPTALIGNRLAGAEVAGSTTMTATTTTTAAGRRFPTRRELEGEPPGESIVIGLLAALIVAAVSIVLMIVATAAGLPLIVGVVALGLLSGWSVRKFGRGRSVVSRLIAAVVAFFASCLLLSAARVVLATPQWFARNNPRMLFDFYFVLRNISLLALCLAAAFLAALIAASKKTGQDSD